MGVSDSKKVNLRKVSVIIFWIIAVLFFSFFMILQLLSKSDYGKLPIKSLNDNWIYHDEYGEEQSISLPNDMNLHREEVMTIRNIIPDDIADTDYICMRSSQQDVIVTIDGRERNRYDGTTSKRAGKVMPSYYILTRLYKEDAGKEIVISYVSHTDTYAGNLSVVYIGERYSIWRKLISTYLMQVIVALQIFTIGLIMLMFALVIQKIYRRKSGIEYLGVFSILFGALVISDAPIRQFYLTNIYFAHSYTVCVLFLLPICISLFFNDLYYKKFTKICNAMCITLFILGTLFIILHCIKVVDLMEVSWILYIAQGLTALMIFVWMIKEIIRTSKIERGSIGIVSILIILIAIVIFLDNTATFQSRVYQFTIWMVMIFLMIMLYSAIKQMAMWQQEHVQLSEREKAKNMLFTNVSHEIRTPLNAVLGMNELILSESKETKTLEYAEQIKKCGIMLMSIINDILDVSRLSSGNVILEEEAYDTRDMLFNIYEMIYIKAEDKGIKLTFEIDPKIPCVLKGDIVRVKQVFINLLNNAVKYTKEGEVHMVLEGAVVTNHYHMTVHVKDTGIGIKNEDKQKLFQSFQRIGEHQSGIEGTGLGLNIALQLTEKMGGTIKVESEYGKGSTFTFDIMQQIVNSLPMKSMLLGKAEEDKKVRKQEKAMLSQYPDAKILIVDDNSVNLVVAKGVIGKTHAKIVTATSGEECLRKTENEKFDLILLDYLMPGMSGTETLKWLKSYENNVNRETPVVAFSANADSGFTYQQEGFDDWIAKPIELERLESVLSHFLKDYQRRDV